MITTCDAIHPIETCPERSYSRDEDRGAVHRYGTHGRCHQVLVRLSVVEHDAGVVDGVLKYGWPKRTRGHVEPARQ